jgi:hypothetical protein
MHTHNMYIHTHTHTCTTHSVMVLTLDILEDFSLGSEASQGEGDEARVDHDESEKWRSMLTGK